jgi:hypothetical protein
MQAITIATGISELTPILLSQTTETLPKVCYSEHKSLPLVTKMGEINRIRTLTSSFPIEHMLIFPFGFLTVIYRHL